MQFYSPFTNYIIGKKVMILHKFKSYERVYPGLHMCTIFGLIVIFFNLCKLISLCIQICELLVQSRNFHLLFFGGSQGLFLEFAFHYKFKNQQHFYPLIPLDKTRCAPKLMHLWDKCQKNGSLWFMMLNFTRIYIFYFLVLLIGK